MSCGLLLTSTSICAYALTFPAGHSWQCVPRFSGTQFCSRNWTQLGVFFPSPLLALALWGRTHDSLTVLLGPSMTCLLLVYTPFLLWQYRAVDSCDFTLHWDALWLASPYFLFLWVAGPVGSAWLLWMCLLLFPEWLSWLRFALYRASAGWTVTGLWEPDHSQWREYHVLIQQEQIALNSLMPF